MSPSPKFLNRIKKRIRTSTSGSYSVTVSDSTTTNVAPAKADLNTSKRQTSSTEYHSSVENIVEKVADASPTEYLSVESLNVEDLADDVYKLRSEIRQQNIESRKLFDDMEQRLSLLTNTSQMLVHEGDDGVTLRSDSFVFKKKTSDVCNPNFCEPDNVSSNLLNQRENVVETELSEHDGHGHSSQATIEQLHYRVENQQEIITRLEIMKEALLEQNKMLFMERKRLEDEKLQSSEIILSKERDIEELQKMLNTRDLGIGYLGYVLINLKNFFIEPRVTLKTNIQGLQNILKVMSEQTETENKSKRMKLSKALASKSNFVLEFINDKML